MKTIMVTGCAGFIGAKVSEMLLKEGYRVIGVDNINDYYDVNLKYWRLRRLREHLDFNFNRISIENFVELNDLFKENAFHGVINLAARAGVRYSLENPFLYLATNSNGNLNLLELCKEYQVPKFVLASTSSLYAGHKIPFHESLPVNSPSSPYAASKKSAEMMAYTYHFLYGLDITVLRYFTVYGPAGRPDMATFRFVKWMMQDHPLEIYGNGLQERDFTYIDDIAVGTIRALRPLGYEVINLGNNQPHQLLKIINIIEKHLGQKYKLKFKKIVKADMQATWANIEKAKKYLDWQPQFNIEEGIKKTCDWFKENWEWIWKLKA